MPMAFTVVAPSAMPRGCWGRAGAGRHRCCAAWRGAGSRPVWVATLH